MVINSIELNGSRSDRLILIELYYYSKDHIRTTYFISTAITLWETCGVIFILKNPLLLKEAKCAELQTGTSYVSGINEGPLLRSLVVFWNRNLWFLQFSVRSTDTK